MGPFPARKLFKRTLNLLCSSIGSRATCHSRTNSHSARLDRSAHGGRGSSRWVSGHIVLCGDPALLEHSEAAVEDCRDVLVVPEFVTAEEGETLLREINRTLRGKSYQYNHWDGAIEGYRETEKAQWSEASMAVVRRLRETAETSGSEEKTLRTLDEVHILDLANDGFIKPHIDSVKFCGDVIAGVSLLSQCVMVFQHETDTSRWIRALLYTNSLPLYHERVCEIQLYTCHTTGRGGLLVQRSDYHKRPESVNHKQNTSHLNGTIATVPYMYVIRTGVLIMNRHALFQTTSQLKCNLAVCFFQWQEIVSPASVRQSNLILPCIYTVQGCSTVQVVGWRYASEGVWHQTKA